MAALVVGGQRLQKALAGFMLGAAGMFATMYSTQAILPELSRDFDVSPSRAGLTISFVVLAVAVGGFVWGPVSDRIGRPRSIRLASLLLVPPTIGVALAPTFEALLVCRTLQGLCMPGLLTVGVPYVAEAFVPRIGARAMGFYVSALVVGGLIGRLGVALASAVVGWRVAIGVLALFPLAAAIAMRSGLPEPDLPHRGGGIAHHLRNLRLIGVSICAGALFFTFVGTFTYVIFRLEKPPFSYSVAGSSLIFLLWLTGVSAPLTGRLAERVGWRRVALGTVLLSGSGVLLTLPDVLPLLVLGLACVASAMFAGVTAAQLGISEWRGSIGAPRRPSTSASTTASARSARTSQASPGRSGGGVASPLPGSSRSLVAVAGIGSAGPGGAVGDRRDMNR